MKANVNIYGGLYLAVLMLWLPPNNLSRSHTIDFIPFYWFFLNKYKTNFKTISLNVDVRTPKMFSLFVEINPSNYFWKVLGRSHRVIGLG